MPQTRDVIAAGAVVSRSGREVLLVHRPRYDDWSFPKGKVDRGEHVLTAAVREVGEETGLQVRLGPPLSSQRYANGSRMKTVHYWTARVVGDDDVSGYLVNEEIDDVRWVARDKAASLVTYDFDRRLLAESEPLRKKSHPLVLLRHAQARSRKTWKGEDALRPLLADGRRQAEALAPLLAAYDVGRIVTSPSARCVDTVAPYAVSSGWPLERLPELSEEGASTEGLVALVDELRHEREASLLCSHRPVLPTLLDAIGVEDPALAPAAFVVAHLRKGTVLATETHRIG